MALKIHNAGLVLLHPFLPQLFQHLKLTENNIWINKTAQHKAVSILEFLATGNEEFEEFNLILNKILFGIEIDEIVATEIQLDDEIKNECEILLSNVISHWSAFRNLSSNGLRENFLKHNGELTKVNNGWLLRIEQNSVDILLNHLPWTIGIIKLPWMNEVLNVEW